MPLTFTNVDLVVSSDHDLAPLVENLEQRGLFCLDTRRENEKVVRATFETSEVEPTLTSAVVNLLLEAEKLEGGLLDLWQHSRRELNFGFTESLQEFSGEIHIPLEVLRLIADAGASMAVTMYRSNRFSR